MQQCYTLLPSRYLALLLSLAHAVSLFALSVLALPLWVLLTLGLLLLLNLGYQLCLRAWLIAPSAVVAFRLEDDGVSLNTRAGLQLAAKLCGNSLVTPYFTVLSVLPQGARLARSVLILPDSLDAESFRRLRVYLQWQVGR